MDLISGIVLVKITAPWCKACENVKDIESLLKDDFPEVKFLECNYDNNKESITSKIPYFILYKNKEKVDELQTSNPNDVYQLISKNTFEF
jgi:thioredoxin-like negative regulator of GroEL